ncbi:hypothetical protein [Streptomyces sp. HNM0574]|uniref:hypothetical protein n=1 Tax=Streptomyces sp. HNM0574 TaxID=2714954 RepID=UPI00146A532F|nr:hypothetical protein [Streptomyces sp. HNM0574]NLU69698.1 hypothetical protein [Streptomyces sp. HNM0574]
MPLRPPPAAPDLRRRSLVTAAVLSASGASLLVSGCSGDGEDQDAAEHTPEAERLRAAEAGRRRTLLERYDATVAAHAPLAARLKPLRTAVARQAEALDGKSRRGRGGAAASARPEKEKRPEVPAKEKDALAALAEEERQAADRHTAALAGAPPELARLLASVAAAGAAHAYLLGEKEEA